MLKNHDHLACGSAHACGATSGTAIGLEKNHYIRTSQSMHAYAPSLIAISSVALAIVDSSHLAHLKGLLNAGHLLHSLITMTLCTLATKYAHAYTRAMID